MHIHELPLFTKYNNKLVHGFSLKTGGVSQGCYASLNMGLHVGDTAAKVITNRQLFCNALNINFENVVCCEQIHKDNIYTVTAADKGKGAHELSTAIKNTDGLITNEKNIPLMLFFADCTPILIYDTVNEAIGLAHAGWRGTIADIAGKTLQAMQAQYNTKPEECIAGIGPCIGQCCYEIGDDVRTQFTAVFSQIKKTTNAVDKILTYRNTAYLSLYDANKILLIEHGILPENISPEKEYCTSCHCTEFYSYRAAAGKTGRHAALLCLK
ncbi:peptidoglycan editing factor PgeF [Pectinatus sottacetonis]|uniref:peptidoglycan editing factor PgeF n=1 Tax=Pectinatus sottacetonis TaxID=1002795 RepID=UPI0018C4C2C2|nr:peptidoglycan editing factor PgeF [Pectinatus sottacetonis]